MSKFDEIRQLQKELKEKIAAVGREGISDFFAPIFAANPSLKSVRWRQYTPYFNDGDACIFNVHDPEVLLSLDETFDNDEWLEHHDFTIYNWDSPQRKAEKQARGSFTWDFRLPDQDILQQIFGDHTEITVNRDGTITQENYEHE